MARTFARARFHCQSRAATDDGMGNEVSGEWQTRFTMPATVLARTGGEQVLGARLEGVQPYEIEAVNSPVIRQMTTDWRLIDAATGLVLAITAIADPDARRQKIRILATSGEAS